VSRCRDDDRRANDLSAPGGRPDVLSDSKEWRHTGKTMIGVRFLAQARR
jgi:hypothetical protein